MTWPLLAWHLCQVLKAVLCCLPKKGRVPVEFSSGGPAQKKPSRDRCTVSVPFRVLKKVLTERSCYLVLKRSSATGNWHDWTSWSLSTRSHTINTQYTVEYPLNIKLVRERRQDNWKVTCFTIYENPILMEHEFESLRSNRQKTSPGDYTNKI